MPPGRGRRVLAAARRLFGVKELALAVLLVLGYRALHGDAWSGAAFVAYAVVFVSRAGSRGVDPRLLPAKTRLDRLELYPCPVRLEGVRVVVWPWFFRWLFPRFDGLCWTARTIIMRDLVQTDDLVTHELCHVWQTQNLGWLQTTWAYVRYDYHDNPYEQEARLAVRLTKEVTA